MFDSSEPWRPRSVRSLFSESVGGQRHKVCHPRLLGDDCSPITGADDLWMHHDSGDYIDIHGSDRNGSDYIGRQRTACAHPAPKDCGSDNGSAIYYNVRLGRDHLYVDYWWYMRYNDSQRGLQLPQCRSGLISAPLLPIPCFDHESDWEGVTVVTGPHDSSAIEWVTYSAHDGPRWRYTHFPSQFVGLRVKVFSANGTHANYPAPCSRQKCSQTSAGGTGIGETRFDGGSPWERNAAAACDEACLLPLPKMQPNSALYSPPASWAAWLGRWGKGERKIHKQLARGPNSPGSGSNGAHYAHPDQVGLTVRSGGFDTP